MQQNQNNELFKVNQHIVNSKEKKNGGTCAANMKQINIWLANKTRNK